MNEKARKRQARDTTGLYFSSARSPAPRKMLKTQMLLAYSYKRTDQVKPYDFNGVNTYFAEVIIPVGE